MSQRAGIATAVLASLALAALLVFWLQSSARLPVRLVAVGDTSGYRMLEELPPGQDPLERVRASIGEPDVFVFNYEGVILDTEAQAVACPVSSHQSTFYTATGIAERLRAGTVSVATLANNHILDCGPDGIDSTIARLQAAGIRTLGAGRDRPSACRPLKLDLRGRKLALLAYLAVPGDGLCAGPDRAGAACFEHCEGPRRIAELAAAGYSVVVALHKHLGPSWTERVHPEHAALVDEVMAAGARIVLGHGAHMPQAVQARGGRLALFGLGNFLFNTDYAMPLEAHRSVLAHLSLEPDQASLRLEPVMLERSGLPYPALPHEGDAILYRIAWLSESFGTTLRVHPDARDSSAQLVVSRHR